MAPKDEGTCLRLQPAGAEQGLGPRSPGGASSCTLCNCSPHFALTLLPAPPNPTPHSLPPPPRDFPLGPADYGWGKDSDLSIEYSFTYTIFSHLLCAHTRGTDF